MVAGLKKGSSLIREMRHANEISARETGKRTTKLEMYAHEHEESFAKFDVEMRKRLRAKIM